VIQFIALNLIGRRHLLPKRVLDNG